MSSTNWFILSITLIVFGSTAFGATFAYVLTRRERNRWDDVTETLVEALRQLIVSMRAEVPSHRPVPSTQTATLPPARFTPPTPGEFAAPYTAPERSAPDDTELARIGAAAAEGDALPVEDLNTKLERTVKLIRNKHTGILHAQGCNLVFARKYPHNWDKWPPMTVSEAIDRLPEDGGKLCSACKPLEAKA